MKKYGSEVCLIDCTFRTTRYDLPLLVVAVITGVGYYPVATALLPAEKQTTIHSALQVLAQWNPDWRPCAFMSDFHEGQFRAIETVFPGNHFIFYITYSVVTIATVKSIQI